MTGLKLKQPRNRQTKKLALLLVPLMILNSACGTIETKRPIPLVIRPVDAAPSCDELLNECAVVVKKQKDAIAAQQDVIKAQDELIYTQAEQVENEKEKSGIWKIIAIVEGALLLLLQIK